MQKKVVSFWPKCQHKNFLHYHRLRCIHVNRTEHYEKGAMIINYHLLHILAVLSSSLINVN